MDVLPLKVDMIFISSGNDVLSDINVKRIFVLLIMLLPGIHSRSLKCSLISKFQKNIWFCLNGRSRVQNTLSQQVPPQANEVASRDCALKHRLNADALTAEKMYPRRKVVPQISYLSKHVLCAYCSQLNGTEKGAARRTELEIG